jgi:hypothetical protein
MNFNRKRFKLLKSESNSTPNKSINSWSSQSTIQNQVNISSSFDSIMRSSNILDDLLRRCREIGNVNMQANTPIEEKLIKKISSNVQQSQLQLKNDLRENSNVVSSSFKLKNSIEPVMYNSNNVYKLNNTPKAKSSSQTYYQSSTLGLSTNLQSSRSKPSKYKLVKQKETKRKQPSPIVDLNVLLGRQVNNISKNKFKFVRKDVIRKPNKYTSQYKLTKNVHKLLNVGNNARVNYRLLLAVRKSNSKKKISYISSPSTRILNIKGTAFKVNKNGLKLKRLNSNRGSSFMISKRVPLVANKYKLINQTVPSSTANKSVLYAK